MRDPDDLWYVRLPDGRVVRAGSTRALRYHLTSGRVPWNSWVRRDANEDWTTLDWVPEFADLGGLREQKGEAVAAPSLPGESVAPPPRLLGVRSLVEDLLHATEGAFNPVKLGVALSMCVCLGLGLAGMVLSAALFEQPLSVLVAGCWWAAMFFFVTLGVVILARMTVLEMARMRPARARDVRAGIWRRVVQLSVATLLVAGPLVGVLCLMPILRDLLRSEGDAAMLALFTAARLLLEVMCWPILLLAFLLGPILIVENVGVFATIRRWLGLLRVHLGRLLVYEALALAVALAVTLPFFAPLAYAAAHGGEEAGPALVVRDALLAFLAGLASTPFFAYFTIANTRIYLNVQYEFVQSARMKRP